MPTSTGSLERPQFPHTSSGSMSSTPRSATSTHGSMSSPSAAASVTQNQPVSPANLLALHSHRSNPTLAALEQAVTERNSLCSQNAQLWKLIEKQRSGYAAILKELERVRAERDAFKPKENTDPLKPSKPEERSNSANGDRHPPAVRHLSEDTTHPQSSQERSIYSSRSQEPLQQSHTHSSSSSSLQLHASLYQAAAAAPSTPQRLPRAAPAPITVSPRADSSPSAGPANQHQGPPAVVLLPASTASTPLRPIRKNSDMSTPSREATDVYATPARPQLAQSSNYPSAPNGAALQQPSPPIALRKDSLQEPASASSFSLSPEPDRLAPQAASSRDSRISLPAEAKRYIQSMGESPSVSPAESPMTALFASGSGAATTQQAYAQAHASAQPLVGSFASGNGYNPSPQRADSLERLRSETSHSDSSLRQSSTKQAPSPVTVDESGERSPPATPMASVHNARTTRRQSTSSFRAEGSPPATPRTYPEAAALNRDAAEREAERLELEQEAERIRAKPRDPEKERVRLERIKAAKERNAREKVEMAAKEARETTVKEQRENALREQGGGGYEFSRPRETETPESGLLEVDDDETTTNDSMSVSNGSTSRSGGKDHTAVEDFPLPPSGAPPQSLYASSIASTTEYSPSADTSNQSYVTSVSTTATAPTAVGSGSTSQNPGAFRALPLIPEDLPYTSIQVSHSSIRPNERGKEVLSFIVRVEPGNGKEGWQVEKLYADVIGLDTRMRASVGKSVIKKMANLPEGKLWKDHAPAKVDQRKIALETYLQNLIALPVKDKNEVIAFFTSDIVREAKRPVMQAGYKEGYLTKRGKNFGGWKTRYFVLHGPVLEYYESRGGTHLGSITITGAQIGRQQRGDKREADEEKEYRHAFLVVEAKRGPGGNHPRHVLCAESDVERDSWVEMLVRYVNGSYSEEPLSSLGPSPINTNNMQNNNNGAPRSSTSSIAPYDYHTAQYEQQAAAPRQRTPSRGMSKDDGMKTLAPEHAGNGGNSSFSPMDPSPIDRPSPGGYSDGHNARRLLERGQSSSTTDFPLSSSLPSSSPLETANAGLVAIGQRSNSEMGHYPDLTVRPPAALSPNRNQKGFQPNLSTVVSSPITPAHLTPTYPTPNSATSSATHVDRDPSPDHTSADKSKISRPIGGVAIPSGFKFGGKDAPVAEAPAAISASDRREKAKSRSFWGFGRNNNTADKPQMPAVTYMSRAVFGVSLEEALDVAQIANLPAVVFRSIQYLEAKQADQEEGIYRLSGSSAVIKALKDRFNQEGDVDLLGSDEYWDMHAIAGMLKSFLRELPASILTRDLHLRFLAVIADFPDPQDRIAELTRLIAALPLANYTLLRALTAHLILIVQNAGTNKMTMRNVGIVFSPTLGIPAGVFSLMLGEFNQVFNVDGEGEGEDEGEESPALSAEDALTDRPAALSRANSHRYSAAAADELLGLKGRALNVPAEEVHIEDDDFSHDENGDDDEITVEEPSSPSDEPRSTRPSDPDTAPHSSKASATAADRGLGLNLNLSSSKRGNRHSRMLGPGGKGLPMSPHPGQAPSLQQPANGSPGGHPQV